MVCRCECGVEKVILSNSLQTGMLYPITFTFPELSLRQSFGAPAPSR
jgi:hypothetical protein